MRIVINALSARLGGGQTYLKNLLVNLPVEPNLEIIIFAPHSLALPKDQRIRRATTVWPQNNPLLRTLWEQLVLPRILASEHADVLFCPGGVVATRVPAGCRVVTMFRNMIPFDSKSLARMPFGLQKVRNFLLRRVMLRSMEKADLTIFISDFARKVIEGLVKVRNPITIPHGISDIFRAHGKVHSRPAWLPRGEYLLYVSRFDVYKHQLEVVRAYISLPENLRNHYKLLLVGEANNASARRTADLISHSGLQDQILILGPIAYTDLPAAYRHAAVNLFASSCENCPNILLEAMGAGRPVLCSNVMPMPEFGSDSVAYFDPTDPQNLCDELAQVLKSEQLQNTLGLSAARRSADFEWVTSSDRTWQAIAALVSK